MAQKQLTIDYIEYQNLSELNELDRMLIKQAQEAAKHAYAPYSKFKVGAVVRLGNGDVVIGNNQENAAYPSGLCAERVALFSASALHPNEPVEAIAISALSDESKLKTPPFPCGACRQVFSEYEYRQHNPIRFILHTESKIIIINGINSLLPFPFIVEKDSK